MYLIFVTLLNNHYFSDSIHMYKCQMWIQSDSVGMLESSFWAAIFNFHGNIGQNDGNYHITTIKPPQWNRLSGNFVSDPEMQSHL